MKRTFAVVAALFLAAAATAEGQTRLRVPIVIGGDPYYDACNMIGVVSGLRADGDGFLAVRDGPGTDYRMIDKLYNDEQVWMCADRMGWVGVVYSRDGRDCNVGRPWPRRDHYTGPCAVGWAHGNWLVPMAG